VLPPNSKEEGMKTLLVAAVLSLTLAGGASAHPIGGPHWGHHWHHHGGPGWWGPAVGLGILGGAIGGYEYAQPVPCAYDAYGRPIYCAPGY